MLRLYDTATGTLRPVGAGAGGLIRLYVCGPTVYGPPHIGHGRFTLVYDVIRRYLESRGHEVLHVSNVTDIDDKIIAAASATGRSFEEVAEENETLWWKAMDSMAVAMPHETPHATEYVPEMVELIAALVERAVAYETHDGVYLSVGDVPGYGLLAQQSLESLRSGARVAPSAGKRDQADFVLWKKAKPGEPSWPSPWGAGRPGWHTECVVMSLALLGDGFELHGGGADLKFPHHENERAQAVALGREFASHWVHNGLVEVGGQKMARSVGNVTSLPGLLEAVDPRAYRLLVLRAHYRSPIEVGDVAVTSASQALERLDSLARRLEEVSAAAPPGSLEPAPVPSAGRVPSPVPASIALAEEFRRRMDDDLDTPRATAAIFDAVRSANVLLDSRDLDGGVAIGRAALSCAAVVGLLTAGASFVSERASLVARQRDDARAARDWAAADRLRIELESLGYRVEDTAAGTRLYRN